MRHLPWRMLVRVKVLIGRPFRSWSRASKFGVAWLIVALLNFFSGHEIGFYFFMLISQLWLMEDFRLGRWWR